MLDQACMLCASGVLLVRVAVEATAAAAAVVEASLV